VKEVFQLPGKIRFGHTAFLSILGLLAIRTIFTTQKPRNIDGPFQSGSPYF
jgi:hypothetical protein